ncbi:MAG: energy transducer TonB [Acidobacteriales bacterium]|nr:energy transducer TonB [Terriglobales bacterium]
MKYKRVMTLCGLLLATWHLFAQESKNAPGDTSKPSLTLSCDPEVEKKGGLAPRVRVSAGVIAPLVRKRKLPDTRDLKKQLNEEQSVKVVIIFNFTGDVACVGATQGLPLLTERSVEAAKGWKFNPFLLNGKPVSVESTIEFNFKGSKVKSVP